MIQGAIFDVDGTLLDSMCVWMHLGENYLRSLGYEPEENLTQVFKSFSTRQAAAYYREHYGVTLSEEEIMAGINDMAARFYREKALPRPGIPEFLEELRKKQVKMCVATATDRTLVLSALERCGIAGYFERIFTCDEVMAGKDQPKIFREARKFLETP